MGQPSPWSNGHHCPSSYGYMWGQDLIIQPSWEGKAPQRTSSLDHQPPKGRDFFFFHCHILST